MPRALVSVLIGLLAALVRANVGSQPSTVHLSEVDRCLSLIRQINATLPICTLEGIVGNAYDALRSIDTMPVLAARYTKCKLTPDGKYLLPDNVDAVPVLQSNMDVMATYYATFEEWYKSKVSYSCCATSYASTDLNISHRFGVNNFGTHRYDTKLHGFSP